MKTFLFILLTLFLLPGAFAQLRAVYQAPPEHIAGLRATANDYPYVVPFAAMDERFFIEFDDLEGDEKSYYYRIRRMDEHWHPSNLLPQEYIDGFDSDMIQTQENSRATLQPYTHYSFSIPNRNTRIKLSGNYLVEILDEDENVLFNIPVIFYEKTVSVGLQAKRTNAPATVATSHMLELTVYAGRLQGANPASDIRIEIYRNANLFEPLVLHQPTFNLGNEWRYHDPQKMTVAAGNEFLSFETRRQRGYNRGVDFSELDDLYHYYLPVYAPSPHYMTYNDIDGSYIFDATGTEHPATGADYGPVHFRIAKDLAAGRDIYVVGRFNNWQLSDAYRLRPVEGADFAETTVLLKQGYYDYYYVGRHKDGRIDWTAVTPSFAETENRYTAVVYYRPPGARYVRVVGMGQAVSKPLK
ncbi:MAG: DUF5103 domain-containing protein [Chlorobi bacterium]|nr:DUF5103 domain-containing protein [Chlorobiota bacterium]